MAGMNEIKHRDIAERERDTLAAPLPTTRYPLSVLDDLPAARQESAEQINALKAELVESIERNTESAAEIKRLTKEYHELQAGAVFMNGEAIRQSVRAERAEAEIERLTKERAEAAERELTLPRNCSTCCWFDGDCHCGLPWRDALLRGAILAPEQVVCARHEHDDIEGAAV